MQRSPLTMREGGYRWRQWRVETEHRGLRQVCNAFVLFSLAHGSAAPLIPVETRLAGNPAEAPAYRVRLTRARQPYPFTPVNTMPWMKYRWAKKKTTIIGTTATTAAAIVRCH